MAKKSRNTSGKLVVFEGADGVGKSTQAKLLFRHLKSKKIPVQYISFPRYDSSWGKQIRRYLSGEFGKLKDIDPYFVSMLYAGDRMAASGEIREWLENGKIVICDRYCASNIGHQAARLKTLAERNSYINWLEYLEYKENKIPKEDLVILLSMPLISSRGLMKGRRLDIHERDIKYMRDVNAVFNYLADLKKNWVRVNCVRGRTILDKSEVHKKVFEILDKRNIVKF